MALLTISLDNSTTTVDLDDSNLFAGLGGTRDWWKVYDNITGIIATNDAIRRTAGGGAFISEPPGHMWNPAVTGFLTNNGLVKLSETFNGTAIGTPASTSGTNSDCVYSNTSGTTFSFRIPVDAGTTTVKCYFGCFLSGTGSVTATVNDSSSSPATLATSGGDNPDTYTITCQANGSTTLDIVYTQTSNYIYVSAVAVSNSVTATSQVPPSRNLAAMLDAWRTAEDPQLRRLVPPTSGPAPAFVPPVRSLAHAVRVTWDPVLDLGNPRELFPPPSGAAPPAPVAPPRSLASVVKATWDLVLETGNPREPIPQAAPPSVSIPRPVPQYYAAAAGTWDVESSRLKPPPNPQPLSLSPYLVYVSAQATGTASVTPDVSAFASLQAFDVLIFESTSNTGSIAAGATPPGGEGWANIVSNTPAAGTMSTDVYWKRWGAGFTDNTTPTFTGPTGAEMTAVISIWRACTVAGNPYDSRAFSGGTSGGGTTMTAVTSASAGPNRTALRIYQSDNDNTPGNPSQGTLVFSANKTGGSFDSSLSASYLRDVGQGLVGSSTMTQTTTPAGNWTSLTIVLQPIGDTIPKQLRPNVSAAETWNPIDARPKTPTIPPVPAAQVDNPAPRGTIATIRAAIEGWIVDYGATRRPTVTAGQADNPPLTPPAATARTAAESWTAVIDRLKPPPVPPILPATADQFPRATRLVDMAVATWELAADTIQRRLGLAVSGAAAPGPVPPPGQTTDRVAADSWTVDAQGSRRTPATPVGSVDAPPPRGSSATNAAAVESWVTDTGTARRPPVIVPGSVDAPISRGSVATIRAAVESWLTREDPTRRRPVATVSVDQPVPRTTVPHGASATWTSEGAWVRRPTAPVPPPIVNNPPPLQRPQSRFEILESWVQSFGRLYVRAVAAVLGIIPPTPRSPLQTAISADAVQLDILGTTGDMTISVDPGQLYIKGDQ